MEGGSQGYPLQHPNGKGQTTITFDQNVKKVVMINSI